MGKRGVQAVPSLLYMNYNAQTFPPHTHTCTSLTVSQRRATVHIDTHPQHQLRPQWEAAGAVTLLRQPWLNWCPGVQTGMTEEEKKRHHSEQFTRIDLCRAANPELLLHFTIWRLHLLFAECCLRRSWHTSTRGASSKLPVSVLLSCFLFICMFLSLWTRSHQRNSVNTLRRDQKAKWSFSDSILQPEKSLLWGFYFPRVWKCWDLEHW